MTYSQGFAHSSNVGMTLLQQKMGDATWLEYLNRFKFGVPTRFGMPDEYAGQLPADNVVNIAMSALVKVFLLPKPKCSALLLPLLMMGYARA